MNRTDLEILRNRLKHLMETPMGLNCSPTDLGEWLIDIGRLNLQIANRLLDDAALEQSATCNNS